MYLDTNSIFALDQILKKFEVAFRSYVADELIKEMPTLTDFSREIGVISSTFKASGFLLSARYKAKVTQIKSKEKDTYNQLSTAKQAYITKTYPGEAPYVSTIVDMFVLFFEKCYSKNSLLKNFNSSDELLYNVNSYHRLRNDLSHPGSRQVLVEDGVMVSKFIRKIMDSLDSAYFWFSSRDEIIKNIASFSRSISENPLLAHNLSEIPLQHKKLFCRENEFNRLHDYIIGREGYQRVAGSVIVYGYGGVGKTALVIDFIFRVMQEIADTENKLQIDFILFYSSKEEFLKRTETTGEVYIEKVDKQIESLPHLQESLCRDLNITNVSEASAKYRKGIIVVDNVENFTGADKAGLYDFIKSMPRNIQFILTSRNEEQCEEKLNIEEYREVAKGKRFIKEYLEFEEHFATFSEQDEEDLLQASKGNTLILVQALNSIINQVSTVAGIVSSLAPMRTKEAHIIADFMYKNTFDNAVQELESKGFASKDIIIIASMYKEPIDLYSISRLCRIDIATANEVCNYLTKRLIFIKAGEYYRINEFANNFILIKMLPERIELSKIRDKISKHKSRTNEKIKDLERKIQQNEKIREIMDDWKPKNYVDKIIIAECFTGFKDFQLASKDKNKIVCDKLLADYADHEMVTNHPYVQFQKARIFYLLCKTKIYKSQRDDFLVKIERCYEDSLESIEFNYPHVRNTKSHGAVHLFFGALLLDDCKDTSRAIRHLEEAERILASPETKLYFDLKYYLTIAYKTMHEITRDRAYSNSMNRAIKKIMDNQEAARTHKFDVDRFARKFEIDLVD